MNKYLKNLNRIEFVVTMACSGKCKHCSQGEHKSSDNIDKNTAADAVRKIASEYNISSVMTFGGEPLLYHETVCAIHRAAMAMNIPQRQLITNGYFSKDLEKAQADMEGKKVKVPDVVTDEICELCGKPMVIKSGKFGIGIEVEFIEGDHHFAAEFFHILIR